MRHVTAGPYEGLGKDDLPGQLCAFAAGVMRAGAHAPEGHYGLVHSHYWLSGQVGWLAADRWEVPLVHTMHTMARVKNLHLAEGDDPEPPGREIGEAQVVEAADRLIANTLGERRELIDLYDAEPGKVVVVPPGVDLDALLARVTAARRGPPSGCPPDAVVLLFVGRIQPLKAPEVLVKAAAELLAATPATGAGELVVAVLGGPSGSGLAHPTGLRGARRGARHRRPGAVRAAGAAARAGPVVPRRRPRRRALALESFGLVAVEAQACGTPVVAADVGGLPTAVGDAGVLVDGHDTADWARRPRARCCVDPELREPLARKAVEHAALFGWDRTAERLSEVYVEALPRPARPADHRRRRLARPASRPAVVP